MSQGPLVFSTNLAMDASKSGRWVSDALKLPGAKLAKVSDSAGMPLRGYELSDGAVIGTGFQPDSCVAVVEVPSDLMPHSAIEKAKLDLEREKLVLEEANRKRTWAWSIGSAVLTAAVTITVALVSKSESSASSSRVTGPATGAIEDCRTSLRRLPLLARTSGQTVVALSEAINRHEVECDEVLVKMLAVR